MDERAEDMAVTAIDPAGRIMDDKTAEARERIDRIEKSVAAPSTRSQEAAREVEDCIPGREVAGHDAAQPFEDSLKDLEAASHALKQKITDEKRRHDMPIDSSLGNPDIEEQNADGRNDLPDIEDE